MSLSKEQAEEILLGLEKKLADDMKAKNLDLILSHYHPDATVVHKNVKSFYGREEIKEIYIPFLSLPPGSSFPIKPTYTGSSPDGEYLMRRGTFNFGPDPRDFPFEQIYKKVNGKYLIYHDEFEYSP